MKDIILSTIAKDREILINMNLWKRIVNMMINERGNHSRRCETDKDDIRFQQGVVFGLDIFLGRVDEKGTKRTSILDKACEGVPE